MRNNLSHPRWTPMRLLHDQHHSITWQGPGRVLLGKGGGAGGRCKPRVSREGKACVPQPSITLERCDCSAENLCPISAQLLTGQAGE